VPDEDVALSIDAPPKPRRGLVRALAWITPPPAAGETGRRHHRRALSWLTRAGDASAVPFDGFTCHRKTEAGAPASRLRAWSARKTGRR
jgi:hypothetical protein